MTRQSTNQAQQRARVSHRRRRRGPVWPLHGVRSQSGIKIRSRAAWRAYVAYQKIVRAEVRRIEQMKAGWRKRAAEKGAK